MPLPMHSLDNIQEGALLLIDKPLAWTSFDVVNKVRFACRSAFGLRKFKVGHAGTLDPMATGLLLVCTGKMTKRVDEFMQLKKEYTGVLRLGATTPSYDAETPADWSGAIDHIAEADIVEAAANMVGAFEQVPPLYSAIKKQGKPLYKYARQGIDVEVAAKPVEVYGFEILQVDMPHVRFRIVCSKGTYIRSMAHDLGKKLHSGAYLTELCRTSIGHYRLEQAWSLMELVQAIKEKYSS